VDKGTRKVVLWALGLDAAPLGVGMLVIVIAPPPASPSAQEWFSPQQLSGLEICALSVLGVSLIGLLAGLYLLVRWAVRWARCYQ
jgi:hypothetical protein